MLHLGGLIDTAMGLTMDASIYGWGQSAVLLALLVFTQQSYSPGAGVRYWFSVICPSIHPYIHPYMRFLRNHCMDPDQILWEATYPPYLQTIFFLSSNFKVSIF